MITVVNYMVDLLDEREGAAYDPNSCPASIRASND